MTSQDKGQILESDTGKEGQEEETISKKVEKRKASLMVCSQEVDRRGGGTSWQISS